MELSIVYIAVVFLLPFALGFMLLGAMAVDADRALRPVSQPLTAAPAKVPAAKIRVDGNLGHCVPA
jgi:hypothetical protein